MDHQPSVALITIIALAMFLGWYLVAIVFDVVVTYLFSSWLWHWMVKSFEADQRLDQEPGPWVPVSFYWDYILGGHASTGGNHRSYEVCTNERGLVLRVPMYTPPFLNLWRWPFAPRLFPPCVIPWDCIASVSPQGCVVKTPDRDWPLMTLRVSDKALLNEAATHLPAAPAP